MRKARPKSEGCFACKNYFALQGSEVCGERRCECNFLAKFCGRHIFLVCPSEGTVCWLSVHSSLHLLGLHLQCVGHQLNNNMCASKDDLCASCTLSTSRWNLSLHAETLILSWIHRTLWRSQMGVVSVVSELCACAPLGWALLSPLRVVIEYIGLKAEREVSVPVLNRPNAARRTLILAPWKGSWWYKG